MYSRIVHALLDCLRPRKSNMTLNTVQKRAYGSEAEENFRWLSSFLATKSTRILTSSDQMDDQIRSQLSSIGQYAEMAHGSISPSFVFQHLEELCQPGSPLEEYEALRDDGARLVSHFRGSVAEVQGYSAFRPNARQLIVAFSGTSSSGQALKDMQTWRVTYPRDPRRSTVHAGFWEMYEGVRSRTFEALRIGFLEYGRQVEELVMTGHSMGGTMCYLLALDLFAEFGQSESVIPHAVRMTLAVFGCPRLGNQGLAQYWRSCVRDHRARFDEASFFEYSVKGYNDGVHTLPPSTLGFRHLTESPLYFYHSHLYRIPPSECEHGAFKVTTNGSASAQKLEDSNFHPQPIVATSISNEPFDSIVWPRGGHNYYNDRDMEKVQRRMRWLDITCHGEEGWKERYRKHLNTWEKKWGRDTGKNIP